MQTYNNSACVSFITQVSFGNVNSSILLHKPRGQLIFVIKLLKTQRWNRGFKRYEQTVSPVYCCVLQKWGLNLSFRRKEKRWFSTLSQNFHGTLYVLKNSQLIFGLSSHAEYELLHSGVSSYGKHTQNSGTNLRCSGFLSRWQFPVKLYRSGRIQSLRYFILLNI